MKTMNIKTAAALILLLSVFSGCARLPANVPELALEKVSWRRAGFDADDLGFAGLADALRQSMEYYRKLPSDSLFIVGPERVSVTDLITTLQNLLLIIENSSLSDDEKIRQIKAGFDIYRSTGADGRGKVLYTGYYEPVISCRRSFDAVYRFPLYRRPDDLLEVELKQFGENFGRERLFGRVEGKKVVPYYSREEIDRRNVLSGRGLEVLWCSDPVDIYILQIQGSGRADLGNGEIVGVRYDGQNGRPYRSIGKYLIETGAVPKENMSLFAIRAFLKEHPDEVFAILDQNPSYVFFRVENKPAAGSIGVPLTAGRSIATDSRLFPKGALALIKTEKPAIAPDGTIKEWIPFTRFVLNQDTGGAIRGPGRVDLFFGDGKEAETAAGHMQQEGSLFFLLRKRNNE